MLYGLIIIMKADVESNTKHTGKASNMPPIFYQLKTMASLNVEKKIN